MKVCGGVEDRGKKALRITYPEKKTLVGVFKSRT